MFEPIPSRFVEPESEIVPYLENQNKTARDLFSMLEIANIPLEALDTEKLPEVHMLLSKGYSNNRQIVRISNNSKLTNKTIIKSITSTLLLLGSVEKLHSNNSLNFGKLLVNIFESCSSYK